MLLLFVVTMVNFHSLFKSLSVKLRSHDENTRLSLRFEKSVVGGVPIMMREEVVQPAR